MRAAADRLVLDVANLKYLATTFKKGDLEACREPGGWTVRQTLGHLARNLAFLADSMPDLIAPGPSAGEVPDWDAINAESARLTATTPLPELLTLFSESRDRLVAQVLALTEAQLQREIVPGIPLRGVINSWDSHTVEHALDILDTLPAAREDPMLLNWVLYADFRRSPERAARQQKLMAEVRERLAAQEETE